MFHHQYSQWNVPLACRKSSHGDAEDRQAEPDGEPVGHAEDACIAVGRQQLRVDDPREREHERDLHVEPDEELVRGRPGGGPERRAVGDLEDQRVDDLVEPVREPHREAGGDDVQPAALDLVGVGVDDERQERDGVPLELRRIADEALGRARGVGVRGEDEHGRVTLTAVPAMVAAMTARTLRIALLAVALALLGVAAAPAQAVTETATSGAVTATFTLHQEGDQGRGAARRPATATCGSAVARAGVARLRQEGQPSPTAPSPTASRAATSSSSVQVDRPRRQRRARGGP